MSPIRVLELRSVWGTGGGPDKTILSGAALKASADVETTVCYIRDARDRVFSIDRRAKDLGIDYAEVVERHSFDRGVWPQLRSLIRQREIDIVHAHDHKTDFLTWLLAKVEPIIPLSTAHGFAGKSLREKLYYTVEKRLLARFPCVIAVSPHIRDELVRTGSHPGRVRVIPNGIDDQLFKRERSREQSVRAELGISPDQFVIGAVGRLEQEKRFDLLVEAFGALHHRRPETRLFIVGEGSWRKPLEDLISGLQLHSSCRLLGERSDVIALHHAFDAFIQSSDREGSPNAVLEAMALETPIIATDVGGTAELITHNAEGVLVPRQVTAAWVSAIDAVVTDREGAARRARLARARVERELSFARRMSRVDAVYLELYQAGASARQHVEAPTFR
jgi:glycosyltransferase involved in cell wall biosynthesis